MFMALSPGEGNPGRHLESPWFRLPLLSRIAFASSCFLVGGRFKFDALCLHLFDVLFGIGFDLHGTAGAADIDALPVCIHVQIAVDRFPLMTGQVVCFPGAGSVFLEQEAVPMAIISGAQKVNVDLISAPFVAAVWWFCCPFVDICVETGCLEPS